MGDSNGDGRDDIVTGDRARGETGSSNVFYAQDDAGTQWNHEVRGELDMSASGCSVADIKTDGRLDPHRSTENIKWYENIGRAEQ